MGKLKRSSYIWLAIGLGTLVILGGIFLAYPKGLIPNVPKPPIQDPNPITFEEVDGFLFMVTANHPPRKSRKNFDNNIHRMIR
jgi:hypothetical protein